MTLGPAERAALQETIETQRLGCELAGSDLYSDVLRAVGADVARAGPLADLLEPVARAPFGDAVLLRLLGALHLLVLDGRAPDLARHFPSAGGDPGPGLADAVVAAAAEHATEIGSLLTQGVQTNEVGRSAALLGGYLELARLGLPLRILEVGASAGLNLLFDRYRYLTADGATFGPEASPLVFDRPWFAAAPDLSVRLEVEERRGSDIAPISVATAEGRLRLRSFVWPDQPVRMARLDAALAVAQHDPPIVDAAPAPSWLRSQLEVGRPGCCTVVSHSIMFQYLSASARQEMLAIIDAAGQAATDGAPLGWLRLEPGGDQAELRLTVWPGGVSRVLATSAYHGPPVVWRVPPADVVRPTRAG